MHCVHSSNTIFTIHTAHTHQLHSVCISYSSHEVIYHDYSVTSCRQLNYNKVAVIANSSRGEMCLTAGAGGDIETLLSCSAVKFQSALSVRFVCSELHVGLVIADGDQHWQLLVLISFAPKQIKWHHLETVRSIEKKGWYNLNISWKLHSPVIFLYYIREISFRIGDHQQSQFVIQYIKICIACWYSIKQHHFMRRGYSWMCRCSYFPLSSNDDDSVE